MRKNLARICIFIGVIIMLGSMSACKKEKETTKPIATMEPYKFYLEWKPEIFEQFGFNDLLVPADVYHEYCEKGKTYVYGEFYTDEFNKFTYFFERVYTTLWGEVRDIEKVLTEKDGVYSFEDKCLIPKKKDKDDFSNNVEYTDEHMKVTIKYDSAENKVSFKCQKIDKTSDKKAEKKEEKKKNKDKK